MNRKSSKKALPKKRPQNARPKNKGRKPATQQVFGSSLRVINVSKPRAKVSSQLPPLSKCALRFALAISQPFHPSARGACLPVYPSPPSFKVTSFQRYGFALGTQGYGFLTLTPTLGSDLPCVFHSTTAYTNANTAVPLSAANTLTTGVQAVTMSNLPFNGASLLQNFATQGSPACGRIVSVGLKVSYIGTTLNESGVFHIYASPNHNSVLANAESEPKSSALLECEVCPIGRKSCNASLYPISEVETSYNDGPTGQTVACYPYSGGDTQINGGHAYSAGSHGGHAVNMGSPCVIIHANGVASSKFLVEVVVHAEYIGSATAAQASPSDSDQRGFEIVAAAAQRAPLIRQATGSTFQSALMTGLKEVASAVKPMAISALANGFASLLL